MPEAEGEGTVGQGLCSTHLQAMHTSRVNCRALLPWARARNCTWESRVHAALRFVLIRAALPSPLQPGTATAAAFLETRRYAAYLGATVEFSK